MGRAPSAWEKAFYVGVFANRVKYPEMYEDDLLRMLAEGDEMAGTYLAEFRAERAAGLNTIEAYRAKYPQFYESELQAA